jgi:hypothetical protein
MLTLIGTIIGLLGSLAPEILKYFTQKEKDAHELEVAKLEMEKIKLEGQIAITTMESQADISSEQQVYQAARQVITGWKFIDGVAALYNSSVRPTITYLFMGTYMLVKYAVFMSYSTAGYTWTQAIQAIWNTEDFAVFSTIMAFWFGGRMMKYSLERLGLASPAQEPSWMKWSSMEEKGNGKTTTAPTIKPPVPPVVTPPGDTHGDK